MPVSAVGAKALELAQHECSAIAAALRPGAGVHESVHGARKGIRRLRALLRLFDASDLDLATEDQRLRRIGKGLSALRDSHVVIESARGMEKSIQTCHGERFCEGWMPDVSTCWQRSSTRTQALPAVGRQFRRWLSY